MKLFPASSAPCLLVAVVVADILLGAAALGAIVGAREGHRASVPAATGAGGPSAAEVSFQLGETGLVRLDGKLEGSLTVDAGRAAGSSVTFTVTAKAARTRPWVIGPLDFSVRGPRGQRYARASGDLHAALLQPGESVKGTLTFAVPAAHGDLVYAPHGGRALGFWGF
jgi:hypothetical protein